MGGEVTAAEKQAGRTADRRAGIARLFTQDIAVFRNA